MGAVLSCLAIGFFSRYISQHMLTEENKQYRRYPQMCVIDTDRITKVFYDTIKVYDMKATVYHPKKRETDNRPYETASGKIIDSGSPLSSRLCGLPRWMLKAFNPKGCYSYGDTVILGGALPLIYHGAWIVADNSSRRNVTNIDFAIGDRDTAGRWQAYVRKKLH